MGRWLGLAGLIIALDQASKHAAQAAFRLHETLAVVPFFNLTLAYNEGAAFSFLAGAGGWQRWFFTALALVVCALLLLWLKRLPPEKKREAAGLAFILGGALGNVIDRLALGHVIDFVDFYYPAADRCLPLFSPVMTATGLHCHWPAFNLADSAIFLGAACLVWDSLRSRRSAAEETNT
ncbi:MAG TPA: signal peptidase II [Gammaproteobacteria bacterium]|nr:signal peptidase II [Gammaproteobacteria bacterium]